MDSAPDPTPTDAEANEGLELEPALPPLATPQGGACTADATTTDGGSDPCGGGGKDGDKSL